jgi:ABC-type spermidine/putrescine transport system permease subunit II
MFFSGGEFRTLPGRIWESLEMQLEPTIAAVSTFLIAA